MSLDSSNTRSRLERAGMGALMLVTAVGYLTAYRLHPDHPHIGGAIGWWGWFDQSWYWAAAKAWAQLDLDPAHHLYLPGYPLLAAPFVRLASVHAFLVPNLACLILSLWLFSRLSLRLLAATMPCRQLVGGTVFAVTSLLSPALRDVWVVPWTTTGAVPLVYAALLAAIRFVERPDRPGMVFWVGLAGACIAGFRPADALPVLFASGIGIGLALLGRRSRSVPILRSLALGSLGVAAALVVIGLPYVLIYGFRESHYVVSSGQIGFEWRFLALHWVMLGLDPRPFIDDGAGLVEAFPWLPVGLAACMVQLVWPSRAAARLPHLVVVLALCLHIALYLCYRDLYPEGFFRYWNYHYFKWVLPVAALYALILVHELWRGPGRLRAGLLALGVLAVLLPWRIQLDDIKPLAVGRDLFSDRTLQFDNGLEDIDDVVMVPADADWSAIYGGASSLSIGGHSYGDRADYKMLPTPGGLLLIPLRPLASGTARLTVGPDIPFNTRAQPLHARLHVVAGLPCWLPVNLARCETPFILSPPELPPSGTLSFQGEEAGFLGQGWSSQDPTGRWTDGNTATLALHLSTRRSGSFRLQLVASAYVPDGSAPLATRIDIDGKPAATLVFGNGKTVTSVIPVQLDGRSDTMSIAIQINNPRSPAGHAPGSNDRRQLGLFVRSLSLLPS